MTLPRPYGLTDGELFAAGGDVGRALELRWQAEQAAAAARPIQFDWQPNSRHWGRVWADWRLADCGPGPAVVVAGLGGSMAGVVVADGLPEAAARAFAADFEAGRAFATSADGAAAWLSLVDSAWQSRKLGIDRDALRALARPAGILPGGGQLTRGELAELYRAGGRAGELAAAIEAALAARARLAAASGEARPAARAEFCRLRLAAEQAAAGDLRRLPAALVG